MAFVPIRLRQALKQEMNTQRKTLFSNNLYWLHIVAVLINLVQLSLAFIDAHKTITNNNIALLLFSLFCTLGLIYTFLLLVIPMARAMRNAWIPWLGLAFTFVVWALLLTLGYGILLMLAGKPFVFSKAYSSSLLSIFHASWLFFSFYYFFDLYYQQGQFKRYQKQLEEKLQAENKFLKSQINPHFLFNTLNNIYSKTLVHSEESTQIIQQLRKLISYMLYDCEQDYVPLQGEIEFIESYIALERIRNKSAQLDIKTSISGSIGTQKIAPLLIVNFVENAFKHGVKSGIGAAFIHIEFIIEGNDFKMNMTNSVPEKVDRTFGIKEEGGIGIANVKKRLALLYPKMHRLTFTNTDNSYSTALWLQLYSF
ncbi:hypothetical protein DBR32_08440 [Taibaiella sp. KBW10]|uniref:sensor histidine kinase n=1 Tax=Taibaiella sp. KBW10 TaxID=2153357 RepID=UPI000F5A2E71|nr:histidine kinase [Taibaiella sp. KBW10]RQO30746.1 hypothetical protein DBR32_08440 [Taibaiella sp. KBW10]